MTIAVAQDTELSPHHKAAVVLLSLGVDAASKVFKNLSRRHARKLTQAMAEVQSVPAAVRRQTLAEFRGMLKSAGRSDPVVSILESSLGKQSASDLLDEIDVPSAQPRFFSSFAEMASAKMAEALSVERPQTCAAVLSHMDAAIAGKVIASLPEPLPVEVAARMAKMKTISPRVLRIVEAELERNGSKGGRDGESGVFLRKVDGTKSLASALVAMPAAARSQMIDSLNEEDPQLAEQVNDAMFVFDDLARVDDVDIQQILREVALEDVALSLTESADNVRDAIMRNLSERARGRVQEEMEFMGRKTREEIRTARRSLVSAARRLGDEGKIRLWEEQDEEATAGP